MSSATPRGGDERQNERALQVLTAETPLYTVPDSDTVADQRTLSATPTLAELREFVITLARDQGDKRLITVQRS